MNQIFDNTLKYYYNSSAYSIEYTRFFIAKYQHFWLNPKLCWSNTPIENMGIFRGMETL